MADRTALGKIGLMLAMATVMVMMIGSVVVADHLTGRLQLDESLGATMPWAER